MGSQAILDIIGGDGEGTRRRAIRNRVLLVAKLATPTREWSVRLRDVSASGARVEATVLPSCGSDVVVRRGTFECFGRVVWKGDGVAGIEFDEPLDEADLMSSLRGLPAAAPLQPYRRGGFSRDADPPRLSTGDGWLRAMPGRG